MAYLITRRENHLSAFARFYVLFAFATAYLSAQTPVALTWQQVKEKFAASNSQLKAGLFTIEESRAQEITAFLRPNPYLSISNDQLVLSGNGGPFRPLANVSQSASVSYLFERGHKRYIRKESAEQSTAIAKFQQADLERNLLFNLRAAFVQALQAKAVLAVTRENLAYYEKLLSVSLDRYQAGDIAQVDLDRLQLQKSQYESDVQSATNNLRAAKIQLLALLNDRTSLDSFDVNGDFDYNEALVPLEESRQAALDARPDLRAALQSIVKADAERRLAIANGSIDPTFGVDFGRNPPLQPYIGVNVTIPLRVFDKNQGEKLRTSLDVTRNERLRDAAETQVYSDVDSAYTNLIGSLALLRRYKAQYLDQSAKVRDTIAFAYKNGGASLLDFLNAQNDYRVIRLNYLNLVGTYMSAASQLNLAVGREIVQ